MNKKGHKFFFGMERDVCNCVGNAPKKKWLIYKWSTWKKFECKKYLKVKKNVQKLRNNNKIKYIIKIL